MGIQIQKFVLIALTTAMIPNHEAKAFGPLKNMAHVVVEQLGYTIRVTAQIGYPLGMDLANLETIANSQKAFQRDQVIPIFNATFGQKPIKVDGEPCTFQTPGGRFSSFTIQMQVIAICKSNKPQISWYLPFIKKTPPYFIISTETLLANNKKKLMSVVDHDNPMLSHGRSLNLALSSAGLRNIGFSLEAWEKKNGDLRLPLGILHLLFILAIVTKCRVTSKISPSLFFFGLFFLASSLMKLGIPQQYGFFMACTLAALTATFLCLPEGITTSHWWYTIVSIFGVAHGSIGMVMTNFPTLHLKLTERVFYQLGSVAGIIAFSLIVYPWIALNAFRILKNRIILSLIKIAILVLSLCSLVTSIS